MKLLLDEMISPAVAQTLRRNGFDVASIKGRPSLEGTSDEEILLTWARSERRVVVTFDADFLELHARVVRNQEGHDGILYLDREAVPRTRRAVPIMVELLEGVLREHPADDALRNRVRVLP